MSVHKVTGKRLVWTPVLCNGFLLGYDQLELVLWLLPLAPPPATAPNKFPS